MAIKVNTINYLLWSIFIERSVFETSSFLVLRGFHSEALGTSATVLRHVVSTVSAKSYTTLMADLNYAGILLNDSIFIRYFYLHYIMEYCLYSILEKSAECNAIE